MLASNGHVLKFALCHKW